MNLPARDYEINLDVPPNLIERGHLNLGGVAPDGARIDVNSQYLERNGEAFIPIVGEFHFSRYPKKLWEESLRKMKAGGVNTVATYVFWNLHEREEGQFDFEGDLDLRRFLELCKKVDLPAIVRVGPFCHGEMRNGGLPDWLYGRRFEVRSNDPDYLACVDRWYGKIGEEIEGLYFKDGGAVIGIQLENEYQHSAAPWELTYPGAPRELTVADLNRTVTYIQISDETIENPYHEYGREHMRALKELALKHGMEVPLYTATGWGNAAIIDLESLPVTAAYAYPFWAKPRPSPFYLYKDIRTDPDYAPASYDTERYPSIAAEIGPGIMPLYKRRPYYEEASLAPMMVRTVGSGSNGIGYYVYHGGSTPVFGRFFSEESSGLPKINYDFQAPIGEYGQVRSHFYGVRPLHLFLESFGKELAPMGTVLPAATAEMGPEDIETLRYAVRSDGEAAFVFMHNFQDHLETEDLEDLSLSLKFSDDAIRIPFEENFTLPSESWSVLPVNLDLDGTMLRSATVQPLTKLLATDGFHYVFVSKIGMQPEWVFPATAEIVGTSVEVREKEDWKIVSGPSNSAFEFEVNRTKVLVVPEELAEHAFYLDESHLIFSESLILKNEKYFEFFSRGEQKTSFSVYPSVSKRPKVTGAKLVKSVESPLAMTSYELEFPTVEHGFEVEKLSADKLAIQRKAGSDFVGETYLNIEYVGDRVMAFIDGELVADHFYHAKPWEIGLRRFQDRIEDSELIIRFFPLPEDAAFLNEFPEKYQPDFGSDGDALLEISELEFEVEYRARVEW